MKLFVAVLCVVGCVAFASAAAIGETNSNINADYQAQKIMQGVDNKIDPALQKYESSDSSMGDVRATLKNTALGGKEVLGWGAGTVVGLGTAAAKGVGGIFNGAVNGMKNGGIIKGITQAFSQGTQSITAGAGTGFSNGLGGIMTPKSR